MNGFFHVGELFCVMMGLKMFDKRDLEKKEFEPALKKYCEADQVFNTTGPKKGTYGIRVENVVPFLKALKQVKMFEKMNYVEDAIKKWIAGEEYEFPEKDSHENVVIPNVDHQEMRTVENMSLERLYANDEDIMFLLKLKRMENEKIARMTPDQQFVSVFDLIEAVCGVQNPHSVWANIELKIAGINLGWLTKMYQFPGQGQVDSVEVLLSV